MASAAAVDESAMPAVAYSSRLRSSWYDMSVNDLEQPISQDYPAFEWLMYSSGWKTTPQCCPSPSRKASRAWDPLGRGEQVRIDPVCVLDSQRRGRLLTNVRSDSL